MFFNYSYMFSFLLHTRIASIRQCQVWAVQWWIIPAKYWLLWPALYTIQLIPIPLWLMVSKLTTEIGCRKCLLIFCGSRFELAFWLVKQFAHNWYFACWQCTDRCSYVFWLQKYCIYIWILIKPEHFDIFCPYYFQFSAHEGLTRWIVPLWFTWPLLLRYIYMYIYMHMTMKISGS